MHLHETVTELRATLLETRNKGEPGSSRHYYYAVDRSNRARERHDDVKKTHDRYAGIAAGLGITDHPKTVDAVHKQVHPNKPGRSRPRRAAVNASKNVGKSMKAWMEKRRKMPTDMRQGKEDRIYKAAKDKR